MIDARSLNQNDMLHGCLRAIVNAGVVWAGETWDIEDWKTIMVSAWRKATRQESKVIRGLEGEPVQLRKSTRKMTKAELSDLIAYVDAWMAEHGIAAVSDEGEGIIAR